MKKQRDNAVDIMKGFGALCVMWIHVGYGDWQWVITPIMLPVFFFAGGLFLDAEKMPVKLFLKKRVAGLLAAWIIISYVQAFVNLSTIRDIVNDLGKAGEVFLECSYDIVRGRAIWFVPAYVISLTIAYALEKLAGKKRYLPIAISASIAVGAFLIMELHILKLQFWNLGASLVNQFIIVAAKDLKGAFSHKKCRDLWYAWIAAYGLLVWICNALFSFDGFDVRNNDYQNILLYFFLAFAGIFALYQFAGKWDKQRFLAFLGRHSLLYFAFGPHGYIVGRKLLELLHLDHIDENIYALAVMLIACIAWILPAMLIDRVCPVLNGKWRGKTQI